MRINPLLQLESRLKSIVDRVKSGALKLFGLHDAMPLSGASVGGDSLLAAGAAEEARELSAANTNPTTWGEAWSRMKRERDFSSLGPGLARLSSLHPFCAWPECQSMVWESCNTAR